jgi:hypothetical protein
LGGLSLEKNAVLQAENDRRIAELENTTAQYEQEQAAANETLSKLFNPAELTKQTKQIHTAEAPMLGTIRYGELTLDDSFVISQCSTDADKSSMAAYLMLKKAYPEMPNYTPANIAEWRKTMPMAEGAALLLFLRGTPAFLRTQHISGLVTTAQRKK